MIPMNLTSREVGKLSEVGLIHLLDEYHKIKHVNSISQLKEQVFGNKSCYRIFKYKSDSPTLKLIDIMWALGNPMLSNEEYDRMIDDNTSDTYIYHPNRLMRIFRTCSPTDSVKVTPSIPIIRFGESFVSSIPQSIRKVIDNWDFSSSFRWLDNIERLDDVRFKINPDRLYEYTLYRAGDISMDVLEASFDTDLVVDGYNLECNGETIKFRYVDMAYVKLNDSYIYNGVMEYHCSAYIHGIDGVHRITITRPLDNLLQVGTIIQVPREFVELRLNQTRINGYGQNIPL